jgi:hypothetical protein
MLFLAPILALLPILVQGIAIDPSSRSAMSASSFNLSDHHIIPNLTSTVLLYPTSTIAHSPDNTLTHFEASNDTQSRVRLVGYEGCSTEQRAAVFNAYIDVLRLASAIGPVDEMDLGPQERSTTRDWWGSLNSLDFAANVDIVTNTIRDNYRQLQRWNADTWIVDEFLHKYV